MRMLYRTGIYEKAFPEELSIAEMLSTAKETGYDFFEINIDRTDKRISRLYDEAFATKLKNDIETSNLQIESLGLSALSTYTLGHPDVGIEEKAIEIFCRAISFAKKLGIRIIQIPACDVPKNDISTEKTKEKLFNNLARLIEYASAHAILIGLENMENDFMNSVEKCLGLIQAIHSPFFRLYSDSGNITNACRNEKNKIFQDMEKGRNLYIAFHFKEVQPNRFGGLFYGDGWVDFPSIAQKAWEMGIHRYVMEYWYTGNPAWKHDLINARLLCDSWLKGSNKGK